MRIAITGGIGSGKSTVAQIIEEEGYKVFSCDKIYDDLIKEHGFILELVETFGDVVDFKGCIDRKKLSDVVFSDAKKLKKLNALTQKKIIEKAIMLTECEGVCYCEVPLLFENKFEKYFDSVIVVLRNIEERIESVKIRDNCTQEDVLKRINNQFDYSTNNFKEYFVIHNDKDLEFLKQKVNEIIKRINRNF